MPLLKSWLESLAKREVPTTSGTIAPLWSGPLPGIEWHDVELSGFTGRFFHNRQETYLRLSVEGVDSYTDHEFFLDRNGMHQRTLPGSWVERNGWLYVPETVGAPHGLRIPYGSPARTKKVQLFGKSGTLTERAEPGAAPQRKPEDLQLKYDPKRNNYSVVTIVGQKNLGLLANLPPAKYAPQNREDNFNDGSAVRFVGDEIVVGTVRYNSVRHTGDYSWRTRSKNASTWRTIVKPFDAHYLGQLLPPFLKGPYRPEVNLGTIALWKDGSLVFPMKVATIRQGDFLEVKALVMQPRNGPPRLLCWRVHHNYMGNVGESSGTTSMEARRAASKAFDHIWFPGADGKIQTQYATAMPDSDLIFDVDTVNNAIIYLMGGQPWKVNISSQ